MLQMILMLTLVLVTTMMMMIMIERRHVMVGWIRAVRRLMRRSVSASPRHHVSERTLSTQGGGRLRTLKKKISLSSSSSSSSCGPV